MKLNIETKYNPGQRVGYQPGPDGEVDCELEDLDGIVISIVIDIYHNGESIICYNVNDGIDEVLIMEDSLKLMEMKTELDIG